MKRVAVIGSHGLFAKYGGFEQLVSNLVNERSSNVHYEIFNPRTNRLKSCELDDVTLKNSIFKASGFEGLFFDFFSILRSFYRVDTMLLLGIQGIPIIPFLMLFKKTKIVCNAGGIEWERKKFGYFAKLYLKLCFKMSLRFADEVILDNEHFKSFVPKNKSIGAAIKIIPYGGTIDRSMQVTSDLINKYPFLKLDYFLSVSRSISDNMVRELCVSFKGSMSNLVIISNLSFSEYGKEILSQFSNEKNIYLIDGLYEKPVLDLIRCQSMGYIHTHMTCGTAPSLVEMIISKRPIISIDNPQNRFTLMDQGLYFKSFDELTAIIEGFAECDAQLASDALGERYSWPKIVSEYQDLF
jgi:hypothetical protein